MYAVNKADVSVRPRVRIEQQIVRAVIKSALEAGYYLSVFDGEEEHKRTNNAAKVLKDIMETDEDWLFIWKSETTRSRFGWVRFVYGNDGWDVINDYTTNLEATTVLKRADELCTKYSGSGFLD